MTESERVTSAAPQILPPRRRKLVQWNIATLLLLMAVVGVWTEWHLIDVRLLVAVA
jgi:hypothetical protein